MTDTPDQTFAALHSAIGGRLFTVTVQDTVAGVARRAYSSHPADYPVSGTKPIQHDRWSLQVLVEGEPFIANTTAEFADVFPDWAQINALGCHSAMNLPVLDGDVVLGTINILDAEGYFDEIRVFAIQAIAVSGHDRIVAAMRSVPMGAT